VFFYTLSIILVLVLVIVLAEFSFVLTFLYVNVVRLMTTLNNSVKVKKTQYIIEHCYVPNKIVKSAQFAVRQVA